MSLSDPIQCLPWWLRTFSMCPDETNWLCQYSERWGDRWLAVGELWMPDRGPFKDFCPWRGILVGSCVTLQCFIGYCLLVPYCDSAMRAFRLSCNCKWHFCRARLQVLPRYGFDGSEYGVAQMLEVRIRQGVCCRNSDFAEHLTSSLEPSEAIQPLLATDSRLVEQSEAGDHWGAWAPLDRLASLLPGNPAKTADQVAGAGRVTVELWKMKRLMNCSGPDGKQTHIPYMCRFPWPESTARLRTVRQMPQWRQEILPPFICTAGQSFDERAGMDGSAVDSWDVWFARMRHLVKCSCFSNEVVMWRQYPFKMLGIPAHKQEDWGTRTFMLSNSGDSCKATSFEHWGFAEAVPQPRH